MRRDSAIPGLVLLAVAACADPDLHSLELDLSHPDGTVTHHTIRGRTWISSDSNGAPRAAWPALEDWEPDAPIGLVTTVDGLRPGASRGSGRLFLRGETPEQLDVLTTIHVDRLEWTGVPTQPFRLEGRISGASSQRPLDSYAFDGTFSTAVACSGGRSSWSPFCGAPWFSDEAPEQRWSVDAWHVWPSCPTDLVSKYVGDGELRFDITQVTAGGARALECLDTSDRGTALLCGTSEHDAMYDSCRWNVIVQATPGYPRALVPPTFELRAAAVGEGCEDRACSVVIEQASPVPP